MKCFYFMFFLFLNHSLVNAQERITLFACDIVVSESGTLLVKETIEVVSEQKKIIHGIVREISKKSIKNTNLVDFRVESVTHNGKEVLYVTEFTCGDDSPFYVYIGDRDVLLPAGKHIYTIVYAVNMLIKFSQNYDKLCWNVTGYGWKLPIDAVQVRILLPSDVPLDQIRASGYTRTQRRISDSYVCENDGKVIMCSTDKPLKIAEGFTIGIDIPKGFIIQPQVKRLQDYSWGELLGVMCVFLFVGFSLLRQSDSADGDSEGDSGGGDSGDGGGGDGW